jgi:hypothetical protein
LLHTGVSPGSIGCAYTYSGPFREAQISEQPLWKFSSSNPDHSQSRAEQLPIPSNFPFFLTVYNVNLL